MDHAATSAPAARGSLEAARAVWRYRLVGVLAVLGAAAATWTVTAPLTAAADMEPELRRLLRSMVLIKGALAAPVVAFVFWRLARPVSPPLALGYVLVLALLPAALVWLWSLHGLPLAALSFYAALGALLGVARADRQLFDVLGDRFVRLKRSAGIER